MITPILRRTGDRSYVIDRENVGQLRRYFDSLGLRHFNPSAGSMFLHRWIYDGPHNERTVITLFPSMGLTCLGPAVAAMDALVADEVAV